MFSGFKGKKSGGWKDKKSFGGDFGGPKEMHPATCSQCNKSCEVPFKPNGRKPVFCNDCFKRDEDTDSAPSYGERRSFAEKRPFRPAADRGGDRGSDRGMAEVTEQLRAVNAKLEAILEALTDGQE